METVMNKIRKTSAADIAFSSSSKVAYDVAEGMFFDLITSPLPPQFATVHTVQQLLHPYMSNPMLLHKALRRAEFPFLSLSNVALGGKVIFVSNESFAPASNLLKDSF